MQRHRSSTIGRRGIRFGTLIAVVGLCACTHPGGHLPGTSAGPEEKGWFAGLFAPASAHLADCSALAHRMSEGEAAFVAEAVSDEGKFRLEYRPAACVACQEHGEALLSDPGLRERSRELGASETYILRAAFKEGDAPGAFAGDLAARIKEVVAGDTVPCAFAHVEATPSLLPHVNILLGFDRPQDLQERTVLLYGPGGPLRFVFRKDLFTRYATAVGDTLSLPGR